MSLNPHTNTDARDLWDLAQRIAHGGHIGPEDAATALRAAEHLAKMDERLVVIEKVSIEGSFAGGVRYAEQRAKARSNLLESGRRVTDSEGRNIIAALVEAPPVRRIATGERAPRKPEVQDLTGRDSAPARTGFKLGDL